MGVLLAAAFFVLVGSAPQSAPDPDQILREADRLAWLRAWGAAEPKFIEAQKLYAARGDERNALYCEVSAFRGRLPRMSVPEASERLAAYLERPLVQSDDLAEQHETNPRSVWGYVQGLTRVSQRTPWQDGRFALDRAASRLLATVH